MTTIKSKETGITRKKRKNWFHDGAELWIIPLAVALPVVVWLLLNQRDAVPEFENINEAALSIDSVSIDIIGNQDEFAVSPTESSLITNLLPENPGKAETVNEEIVLDKIADGKLIAIVIDDFGPALNRSVISGFLELPHEITIAIIPGNDLSQITGERAVENGKEVIIHMPMEPVDSVYMDERDMIFSSSSREEIEEMVNRTVNEIPQAVGMNNHMGSRATADAEVMQYLAGALDINGLYFVDSKTTAGNVCRQVMRQLGVPCIENDVFLDFTNDKSVIRKQLYRVSRIAAKRGWALAIGHCRRATLETLQAEMGELEKLGFQFVTVSGVLKELHLLQKTKENDTESMMKTLTVEEMQ